MPGEQLLYAALAAVTLLHLVVLVGLLVRDDEFAGGEATAVDGGTEADGGTVACPSCDAPNERGYRYCRACVAELPGADARTGRATTPQRGSVL